MNRGREGEVLYRRSPHLVMYWRDKDLLIENYASGTRITAAPIVFQILQLLESWRPAQDLFRALGNFDRSSVRRALEKLTKYCLLERSDRPRGIAVQAMETWKEWNPAAGFFHFSTKDTPYHCDAEPEYHSLQQRARGHPSPEATKHYPSARQFKLPAPRTAGELPSVLLARRTWWHFSERPIEVPQLSTLLGLTWGVQRWVEIPGFQAVPLKTSPSAGSLHPIEAYVLALRVKNLPRGIYHYAADTHRLELLRAGANANQLSSYLARQSCFRAAGVVVFMTAVFARTQWKYESPRSYRVVLVEAGHLCQTFCILATWLGLAPFCTLALADSRVEQALGVDGVSESVLYAAGAGTRPCAIDWAPSPSSSMG